jgi:hypothetical protein
MGEERRHAGEGGADGEPCQHAHDAALRPPARGTTTSKPISSPTSRAQGSPKIPRGRCFAPSAAAGGADQGVIAGDAATTNSGPVKGHRSPAWLRSPCGELCTEAEHEPVDRLVHDILGASSAGDSCSSITEWTGLGQGEKSAVFPRMAISKSEWMNLFQRFGAIRWILFGFSGQAVTVVRPELATAGGKAVRPELTRPTGNESRKAVPFQKIRPSWGRTEWRRSLPRTAPPFRSSSPISLGAR